MKRIARDGEHLGLDLSGQPSEKLERYMTLLVERALPRGMVSGTDEARLYDRHVLDSLRATVAFESGDRVAYDLGSGAGLPGIVLAIALPAVRFVLAERRPSRAAFLEYAVERLGVVNAAVHAGPAEDLPPEADVATARAFAPLERAWPFAARLLRAGGRLVYFPGESVEDPAAAAADAPGPPRDARVVLATGRPLVIMALK